ncbi:MAG: carbon-nitrogen hydrolase family protein [Lentisphaeria bacterium]|nr:carbon-nitrogen hydrolase family protein [Lentisphaeria bacterium]MBR7143789.1 carbon-nitrogen hydrolase family protein [Lentisphaeria bacterium]
MKVAIVQVPYPQPGEALKTLQWQIDLLNNWEDKSVDLIIFPENANCTGYTDKANMLELINNQGKLFEQAMEENAKRLNSTIVSGLMTLDENGILRNQLAVYPPDGEKFIPYTKVHLVEPEIAKGIVAGEGAKVFEYKGVRFGAAICFDYYFPELFIEYAKARIDVMIIASHQRQERPEILDFVTRTRAFDLGCTVLRAAPAMYTANVGGKSMAVAPDGTVIADAGGVPGVIYCEIDPKKRFTRPASYGEPDNVIDYREALLLSRSHVDK